MTDDIEDLVRRSLAAHADAAPAPDGLASRVQRRHRRALIAAVAAVVVVIAGGGTGLGIALSRPTQEVSHGPIIGAPRAASTRTVAFHGIDVSVPKSWSINQAVCGLPSRNTVVLNGAGDGDSCPPGRQWPDQLSQVRLGPISKSAPRGGLNLRVGNYSARDTVGVNPLDRRRFQQIVVIGALGVMAQIDTVTKSLGDQIVASIRAVDRSPEGCSMRQHNTINSVMRRIANDSQAGGIARELIPRGAISIALCDYDNDGWLASSSIVRGGQARQLVTTIDAAPTKLGYQRQICRQQTYQDDFALIARYRTAPSLYLSVAQTCGITVAANGRRQGRLDERMLRSITTPLHVTAVQPDL